MNEPLPSRPAARPTLGEAGPTTTTERSTKRTKHPDFLVRARRPFNGGPPPELQRRSYVTPNELFFVRNHAPVPEIDPATYRLRVTGRVGRPLSLSLADLAAACQRHEVMATLQCAGQRREEMAAVRPIPGELPWGQEAMSNARWSGFRLVDVLEAAGLGAGAAHVGFTGLDTVERGGRRFGFGGSIPLAKARAPEVLLADRMNGEPLPPDHGAPLRVVVPGYIGARSVKWLGEIEVRDRSSDNHFQASSYRLYPTGAPHSEPDEGFELGEPPVSSLIAAPAPGSVRPAGPVRVQGIAYAGGGRAVRRVEVSVDDGGAWVVARLQDAPPSSDAGWAWSFFEVDLTLPAGEHEIVARAFDTAGQTQPENPGRVWNFKGYLNSAWARTRVVCH